MSTTQERSHFIGGSDAASVLGISPWRTPLQLWQEKTQPDAIDHDADSDQQRHRALTRGKRLEPYVCDMLAQDLGLAIIARNQRYIDPAHAFLAAEIDAEAQGDAGSVTNVEIKTVSPFKAREWGEQQSDEIPVHYTAQAQHGLMVTGRALCIFGVLIGGDDFRVYRVERDDEIIDAMRSREIAFWRDHVLAGTPPAPSNSADVERLFGRDAGTAIEATPPILTAFEALRQMRAEAKELAHEIEEAEADIKAFMRDAARLTSNGRDIATWKTQSARRFDQRAFQAAEPALFERFLKTTESRVFRLK